MESSKEDDGIESSVEGDVKGLVETGLGDSVGKTVCNHGAVESSGTDIGVGLGRGTVESGGEKSVGDRSSLGEGDEVCVSGGLDGSVGDEVGKSLEEDSARAMVGNSVGGGEGGGAETGLGSAAGDGEGARDVAGGCSCTGTAGDSEEDGEDWMGGGVGGSAGIGVDTSVGCGSEE